MCAEYHKNRHDIGLLRQDGTTTVGLMLSQDKNGVPKYQVMDDEFLANQQFSGDPDYGALPPEKSLVVIEDDWRKGISQEVFDSTNAKYYLRSYNMDLRFAGMAFQSYKPTTLTKPTKPTATIVNADMELNSDWTDGSQSSTFAYGGSTYSFSVVATATTARAYQDLATYHQNIEYTFTCYVYQDAATKPTQVKIGIDDGVTETLSSALGVDDTWTQLSVTKTLADTATRLRLVLHVIESGGSPKRAYFDNAAITVTALTLGTVQCSATFNGNEYASFGKVLAKLNTSSGTTFDFVRLFRSTITAIEPCSDGFLYIAQESDTDIENCEDAWTSGTHGTASLDTSDYKVGSGSVKIVVASPVAGDKIAYENFSSLDISNHTGVKFWIKCSKARAAADLCFLLDDTAAVASPTETINIPALVAHRWTKVYIPLATPANCTALLSVGLEFNANAEACNIWIDAVQAEDHYWYMSQGEVFTKSTHASGFAKWFKTIQATAPKLYKALPPNELKSATEPKNTANWTAATTVDSDQYDITELVANEDDNSLQIAKEDRVFYIDSTGAVQVLVGDTASLAATNNGKNSFYWQGKTYFPYGVQSLIEYDGGTITWRDPSKDGSSIADFDGSTQGIAGDERFLFVVVDNSTKVEVMSGSQQTVDGTTAWAWHPTNEITLTGCEYAWVSNIYQRRLYISSTTASEALYYIPLPIGYGDVPNDANRTFDTAAASTTHYFETPFHHFNFKGENKAFIKVVAWLGHAHSTTIYFECWYKKLNDSSWTDAGDFKGTSTTREATLYIPVDGAATPLKPVSTMMRFKLVPITNSATTTAILKRFEVHGILRPTKRKIIRCAVRGVDNPMTRMKGVNDRISAEEIKTVLDEANAATWPVTFYDIDYERTSTLKYVNFLPMTEAIIRNEAAPFNLEKVFYLTLQEITLA